MLSLAEFSSAITDESIHLNGPTARQQAARPWRATSLFVPTQRAALIPANPPKIAASPADTGDQIIIATFDFETSSTPLTRSYLMPLEFYSVTDGRVANVPSIGGTYYCAGGVEGRESLHQLLPNATFERIENFMVPLDAEFLEYR